MRHFWQHRQPLTVKDQPHTGTCRIRGKVIESFEGNGEHRLRLLITGGDVEIPIETPDIAHLGDTLQVEGSISLISLTTTPELSPPLLSDLPKHRK
jgi:hypothetical protein